MDLAPSLYRNLLAFFDSDNIKYDFANSYVEELKKEEYEVPTWITEIKEFILNDI